MDIITLLQDLAWTISIASGLPFFAGMILVQILLGISIIIALGIVMAFMRIDLARAGSFIMWVGILVMYGVGFTISVLPGGMFVLILEIGAGVLLFAMSKGYGFKSGGILLKANARTTHGSYNEIYLEANQTTIAPKAQLELPVSVASNIHYLLFNEDRKKHNLPLVTLEQYHEAYGHLDDGLF